VCCQFTSASAIGSGGANVTVSSGGAVALSTGVADLPARINSVSTGALALTAADGRAHIIDFTVPNIANMSLGAVGAVSYSGTITPNNATYRVGGAGTSTLVNSNALTNSSTGNRDAVVTGKHRHPGGRQRSCGQRHH